MSYVIRVNDSRFGKPNAWVLEDSLEPNKLGTLALTETTSKKSAKRYPSRAVATEIAMKCAIADPDYMGKLSVQWVPACGL